MPVTVVILAIVAVGLGAALAFEIGRKTTPATPPAPGAPPAAPFNLTAWLAGYKSYIVLGVGAAKIWYVAIYGKPWSDNVDNAINATLLLLFGGAIRSAMKTSTAEVTNAVVNPTSLAAKATAAEVPKP